MLLQYEDGGSQETQESMKRSHNRLLIYLKSIMAVVPSGLLQLANGTSLLFTVGMQGRWRQGGLAGAICGERLLLGERARVHILSMWQSEAELRRKPLSEPRDWSVLRDLINKGKISLKKENAAVSKGRSGHDSSAAYQRHEVESQKRSEVMFGKSMSTSSHCKFRASLLLHVP